MFNNEQLVGRQCAPCQPYDLTATLRDNHMSLWKTLFGNTGGAEEPGPNTVVAHILDPNSGYRQQKWLVGRQLSQEVVDRLGENGEVFVVIAYEGGKPKSTVCKKAIWLQTKAQFEAIEGEGHAAVAPTVQTATRGSRERPIIIERPRQIETS